MHLSPLSRRQTVPRRLPATAHRRSTRGPDRAGRQRSAWPPESTLFIDPAKLAATVVIYRDGYGVPHIDAATDAGAVFGFAYAQAEDYFWQVEDTYILALGRYSEVHGAKGLELRQAQSQPSRSSAQSQEDFPKLDPADQHLCAAFAAGLNYYLEKNPQVKPRLITRFEPWHVMAFARHVVLELCFRYTRLHHNYMPRGNEQIWCAAGSNAWAIGPVAHALGQRDAVRQPAPAVVRLRADVRGASAQRRGLELHGRPRSLATRCRRSATTNTSAGR